MNSTLHIAARDVAHFHYTNPYGTRTNCYCKNLPSLRCKDDEEQTRPPHTFPLFKERLVLEAREGED